MHYRVGLVGADIAKSPSPGIHYAFAKAAHLSLEYTLERLESKNVEALLFENHIVSLMARGFHGCNITAPFKAQALKMAHVISESAQKAGAANTLVFLKDQRILADNTDTEGFAQDIQRLGYSFQDQSVLILGAGGAVSGILPEIFSQKPRKISLYNRTLSRALPLQKKFPLLDILSLEDIEASGESIDFNIIIDGTSSRDPLSPGVNSLLGRLKFSNLKFIYDLKYLGPSPEISYELTPILSWAKARGVPAHDGYGMLVYQAALSFERWTGIRPSLTFARPKFLA